MLQCRSCGCIGRIKNNANFDTVLIAAKRHRLGVVRVSHRVLLSTRNTIAKRIQVSTRVRVLRPGHFRAIQDYSIVRLSEIGTGHERNFRLTGCGRGSESLIPPSTAHESEIWLAAGAYLRQSYNTCTGNVMRMQCPDCALLTCCVCESQSKCMGNYGKCVCARAHMRGGRAPTLH